MVRPRLRTKSIGFKVSEEQYARLEKAARAGGYTVGEWCRQVALEDASGGEVKPTGTGVETQALMAEVVGMRAILLNVLFQMANGQRITAEEMQRLIDRVDSDKLKKARERLALARESEGQGQGKS